MNFHSYKVYVVLVTWNNQNDIFDCLKSIENQTWKNLQIIVVDNNSFDKTTKIIETYFPHVKLLKSQKNLYFTGGYNFGINFVLKNFHPEFILIANPDTVFDRDLILNLMESILKNERIGAVGPKIKFLNGKHHQKLYSCGIIYDGFMQTSQRGTLQEDRGQFDKK